jgi:hypothetical protein
MTTKGAHSVQAMSRNKPNGLTLSTSLHTHQPFVYDTKYCWRHITKPLTHRYSFLLFFSSTLRYLPFFFFHWFFAPPPPILAPWATVYISLHVVVKPALPSVPSRLGRDQERGYCPVMVPGLRGVGREYKTTRKSQFYDPCNQRTALSSRNSTGWQSRLPRAFPVYLFFLWVTWRLSSPLKWPTRTTAGGALYIYFHIHTRGHKNGARFTLEVNEYRYPSF